MVLDFFNNEVSLRFELFNVLFDLGTKVVDLFIEEAVEPLFFFHLFLRLIECLLVETILVIGITWSIETLGHAIVKLVNRLYVLGWNLGIGSLLGKEKLP